MFFWHRRRAIPVVLLHREVRGAKAPVFALSLENVGRYAATMALEHHHRRVAVFTSGNDPSMQTFFGSVKEKLAEAGCDLPDSMFFSNHSRTTATIAMSSDDEVILDRHLDHLLKMPKKERPNRYHYKQQSSCGSDLVKAYRARVSYSRRYIHHHLWLEGE